MILMLTAVEVSVGPPYVCNCLSVIIIIIIIIISAVHATAGR